MGLFNDAGDAFNQVTDTIGDGAADVVSDAGDAFNQVTDTIGGGAADVVSNSLKAAEEAVNQATDTIGDAAKQVTDTVGGAAGAQISYGIKAAGDAANQVTDTLNNVLPGDIGKNLGLALYGILAVGAIAVFGYILWTLKPLFEIGANVSEK